MTGVAVAHDGKFGFVVYELELPYSVVERYCVKRHAPDGMLGTLARVQTRIVTVPQTPVDHYHRPDTDPSRESEPLD